MIRRVHKILEEFNLISTFNHRKLYITNKSNVYTHFGLFKNSFSIFSNNSNGHNKRKLNYQKNNDNEQQKNDSNIKKKSSFKNFTKQLKIDEVKDQKFFTKRQIKPFNNSQKEKFEKKPIVVKNKGFKNIDKQTIDENYKKVYQEPIVIKKQERIGMKTKGFKNIKKQTKNDQQQLSSQLYLSSQLQLSLQQEKGQNKLSLTRYERINKAAQYQKQPELINFQNQINHSKDVNEVIQNLKAEQSKLTKQQLPFVYSYAVRAFARLIRKTMKGIGRILAFLGSNYQKLRDVDLTNLQTISIFDFVSFFHQIQMLLTYKAGNYKIFVIDRYLKQLLERLKQQKSGLVVLNTSKLVIHDRYFSYLLIAARCSSSFNSYLYPQILKHLLLEIKQTGYQKQMTSYRIRNFTKFLLKMENLTAIQQQIQVLQYSLQIIIKDPQFLKDISFQNLLQIYTNLLSIKSHISYLAQNQSLQIVLKIVEKVMLKREKISNTQQLTKLIYNLMSKNDYNQIFQEIYKNIFRNITANGQCAFNPISAFILISILTAKQVTILNKIDSQWENKFIRLFQRYFLGPKIKNNLAYLFHNIQTLYKNDLLSVSTFERLLKHINPSNYNCIIPLHQDSLIYARYYLKSLDWANIYKTIFQLQEYIHILFKDKPQYQIFQRLFKGLKQSIPLQYLNKFQQENYKLQQQGHNKVSLQGQNKGSLQGKNQLSQQKIKVSQGKEQENDKFNSVIRAQYIKIICNYCRLLNRHDLMIKTIIQNLQFVVRYQPYALKMTLLTTISIQLSEQNQIQLMSYFSKSSVYLSNYLDSCSSNEASRTKIDSLNKFRIAYKNISKFGSSQNLLQLFKNKSSLPLILKTIPFQNVIKTLMRFYQQKIIKNFNQFMHISWRILFLSKQNYNISNQQIKEFAIKVFNQVKASSNQTIDKGFIYILAETIFGQNNQIMNQTNNQVKYLIQLISEYIKSQPKKLVKQTNIQLLKNQISLLIKQLKQIQNNQLDPSQFITINSTQNTKQKIIKMVKMIKKYHKLIIQSYPNILIHKQNEQNIKEIFKYLLAQTQRNFVGSQHLLEILKCLNKQKSLFKSQKLISKVFIKKILARFQLINHQQLNQQLIKYATNYPDLQIQQLINLYYQYTNSDKIQSLLFQLGKQRLSNIKLQIIKFDIIPFIYKLRKDPLLQ